MNPRNNEVVLYILGTVGGRVQPICLPLPGETIPPGTTCIVGGWGRMRERKLTVHLPSWLWVLVPLVLAPAVEATALKHMYRRLHVPLGELHSRTLV